MKRGLWPGAAGAGGADFGGLESITDDTLKQDQPKIDKPPSPSGNSWFTSFEIQSRILMMSTLITDPPPLTTTPPLLPSALVIHDLTPASPSARPSPPRAPSSHTRRTSTPNPPRTGHPLRSSTAGPGQSGPGGVGMGRIPSETGVSRLAEPTKEEDDEPVEPLNLLKLAGGVVKSRNGTLFDPLVVGLLG